MTMITPSYLGETIEYSSLHACRSTLEDPTPCGAGNDTILCGAGNDTIEIVTESTGSVPSRSVRLAAMPRGAPRIGAGSASARFVLIVQPPPEPVP